MPSLLKKKMSSNSNQEGLLLQHVPPYQIPQHTQGKQMEMFNLLGMGKCKHCRKHQIRVFKVENNKYSFTNRRYPLRFI